MILPGSGIGSSTTDPGCRTISMSTVCPVGSLTTSISSWKIRPLWMVVRASSSAVHPPVAWQYCRCIRTSSMKRREFIVSSVAGSVGAGSGAHTRSPQRRMTCSSRVPSSTRKILIAGGNFNTAFIRYMAQLTGKPRPKLLYLPTASADSAERRDHLVSQLRAAQRRAVAPEQLHRQHRSSRAAGKRCSCRSTASSARAATRSISRRSGRRRASTRSCARRGIAASCSAAPARDRCAGSKKARPIRGRRNCRRWMPRLPQGQPLAALRCRAGPPSAVSEADRLRPDEAGLRVRQRRRHLLRGQHRQARRLDARRPRRCITSASRAGRSSRR